VGTFPTRLKAIIIELERRSGLIGFPMCFCLYMLHHHLVIHYDVLFSRAVLENLSDFVSKNGNYQIFEMGNFCVTVLILPSTLTNLTRFIYLKCKVLFYVDFIIQGKEPHRLNNLVFLKINSYSQFLLLPRLLHFKI
jgi:hypothetical protein